MTNIELKIKQLLQLKGKIEEKVIINSDSCWIWQGVFESTYPILNVGKYSYKPHKVMLSIKLQNPNIKAVINTCGDKTCVNPDHYIEKKAFELDRDILNIDDFPPSFWFKFVKRINISDQDLCWNFSSSLDNEGYGRISYMRNQFKAHRLSYLLHYKELPNNKIVCHTCDNPQCVNPKHLFLGTQKDNIEDMVRKGRNVIGHIIKGIKLKGQKISEATRAKLSAIHKGKPKGPMKEETKKKLRQINLGKTYSDEIKRKVSLASQNRSEETKSKLSERQKERHARGDYANSTLTVEQVIEIKKLLQTMMPKEIAKIFNVNPSNIYNIKKGKTWKHIS